MAEKALYHDLREETDYLHANLVEKGIRRAIEAVQSGVEKLKKGEKTSQPEFDSWSIVYDKRSATFDDDLTTLATPNGRITAKYVLPPKKDAQTHRSASTTNQRSGTPPAPPSPTDTATKSIPGRSLAMDGAPVNWL